jgi:hypothetical protein
LVNAPPFDAPHSKPAKTSLKTTPPKTYTYVQSDGSSRAAADAGTGAGGDAAAGAVSETLT